MCSFQYNCLAQLWKSQHKFLILARACELETDNTLNYTGNFFSKTSKCIFAWRISLNRHIFIYKQTQAEEENRATEMEAGKWVKLKVKLLELLVFLSSAINTEVQERIWYFNLIEHN